MRAALIGLVVATLLGRPQPAAGQRVTIRPGTLALPAGFAVQELRGTDSAPGVIRRADGSLVIHYDIGAMAGARVHPGRRRDFAWFIEHEVSGRRAYSGLILADGRRQLATTVLGDSREAWSLPANFVADVRSERDVAEFMLVVSSYRPASRR